MINKFKKDKFMGLHGQPLLNLGFSTMIYAQAEFITSLGYTNANLSVSNVGAIRPESLAFENIAPTAVWVGGGAKEKPCAALNVLSYNGKCIFEGELLVTFNYIALFSNADANKCKHNEENRRKN